MHVARRSALVLLGSSALAGLVRPARAGTSSSPSASTCRSPVPAAEDATNILHGAQLAIEEANARGGIGGYEIRAARAGRRHRDGRPVRSRAVGDQHAQDDRRPHGGRRGRPDGERQRQGDGATAQPGQPRHGDAEFDQPRPDRPEVRRDVPARRQGDLLPHLHHRCLPGSQHGQLHGGPAQGEVGLRGRRHRRLWRGTGRCVPGAVRPSAASR